MTEWPKISISMNVNGIEDLPYMELYERTCYPWYVIKIGIFPYMPTVQIKEEHSSFWEKIIIILMQVFLFLYKFVCSIE